MAKRKVKNHTTGLAAAFAASALVLLVAVSPAVKDTQYAAFTKTTIRRSTTPQTSGTAASMAPARAVAPAAKVQRSSARSEQARAEFGYGNDQALAKTVCDCSCKKRGLTLCPVQYGSEPYWGAQCPHSELYSVEASPDTDCSVLNGVSCYGTHPDLGVGDVFYGNLDFCIKYVRAASYYR